MSNYNFEKCKKFILILRDEINKKESFSRINLSYEVGYRIFYDCWLYSSNNIFVKDLIFFLNTFQPTLYELHILYDLCIMIHKNLDFQKWYKSYQIYILPLDFKCYLTLLKFAKPILSNDIQHKFNNLIKFINI